MYEMHNFQNNSMNENKSTIIAVRYFYYDFFLVAYNWQRHLKKQQKRGSSYRATEKVKKIESFANPSQWNCPKNIIPSWNFLAIVHIQVLVTRPETPYSTLFRGHLKQVLSQSRQYFGTKYVWLSDSALQTDSTLNPKWRVKTDSGHVK